MEFIFKEYPFLPILVTVILTLIGKMVFERLLAKSSRVTAFDCEKNRKACQAEILAKVDGHRDCLEKGDGHFRSVDTKIMAMAFALLKICNKLEIDCEEITKKMVESETIK